MMSNYSGVDLTLPQELLLDKSFYIYLAVIALFLFVSIFFSCFCLFYLREDENRIRSLQHDLEKGFQNQIIPDPIPTTSSNIILKTVPISSTNRLFKFFITIKNKLVQNDKTFLTLIE
jgi:hypothetical protein